LAKGKAVQLIGFGNFTVSNRAERGAHGPALPRRESGRTARSGSRAGDRQVAEVQASKGATPYELRLGEVL
jgi:hypothetical protein